MVPTDDLDMLRRMSGNVIAVGRRGRTATTVADFEAFLSASSRDYFMSFAVPRPPGSGADHRSVGGWAGPLTQLTTHFADHDRTLRLEFFAELFPNMPDALAAASVRREKRAPVMAASPDSFRPPDRTGLAVSLVEAGNMVAIERFMSVQSGAFGVRIDPGPTGWRPILEAGLADGGMIATIGEIDGKACCGAVLMIGGGAAELAGVGTLPAYRRQGYAADLCGRLLGSYLEHTGAPVWLSADDDIAEGLYGALGFHRIGTQLNYGRRRTGG